MRLQNPTLNNYQKALFIALRGYSDYGDLQVQIDNTKSAITLWVWANRRFLKYITTRGMRLRLGVWSLSVNGNLRRKWFELGDDIEVSEQETLAAIERSFCKACRATLRDLWSMWRHGVDPRLVLLYQAVEEQELDG